MQLKVILLLFEVLSVVKKSPKKLISMNNKFFLLTMPLIINLCRLGHLVVHPGNFYTHFPFCQILWWEESHVYFSFTTTERALNP